MTKFWKWVTNRVRDQAGEEQEERALFLNGAISETTWFEDDITPQMFRDELNGGKGNITVWINSPGGDCFAAAQIYNMLRDYKGKVTVKIDSLAASAASVIAMAGDDVQISPTGMLMIHNPSTVAMGDHADLEKAIDMLNEVKNSIINAYEEKTGLSRNKLSKLMEDETWMDAKKAVELGFADSIITRDTPSAVTIGAEPAEDEPEKTEDAADGMMFQERPFEMSVTNQLLDYAKKHPLTPVPPEAEEKRIMAADCYERLKSMKDSF